LTLLLSRLRGIRAEPLSTFLRISLRKRLITQNFQGLLMLFIIEILLDLDNNRVLAIIYSAQTAIFWPWKFSLSRRLVMLCKHACSLLPSRTPRSIEWWLIDELAC
jgi:hypothetical protein